MMRSMYSGVSGLRVHQSKMDTIGNNIANVNTAGFKRGQVTFQEVFSQVVRGASAPSGGKGGTNPQQVGMGVGVGSINTIHTVGTAQRTENPTDLMIDGEGFLVVSDDVNFNNKYYTRAGNLTTDKVGNLVTAEGFKVLGYAADEYGKITSDVTGIRINKSETSAPTATTGINFKGNLDSKAVTGDKRSMDTVVRDSLGNSYKITFEFIKTADPGKWDYAVTKVTDVESGNVSMNVGADGKAIGGEIPGLTDGGGTLTFNDFGKLIEIDGTSLSPKPNPAIGRNLGVPNDISFNIGKDGKVLTAPVEKNSGVFSPINIFNSEDPDTFKDITQYSNEMNLQPHALNGDTSGTLEGFSIDSTGIVLGSFSNGDKRVLGQIMLAKFDNPMGLQKMGGNFFLDTRNSGEAQFGTGGSSGFGPVKSGTLEMSNVDISLEFTEMITTQRGFQANSRIITTSDEMLQELVNLKR